MIEARYIVTVSKRRIGSFTATQAYERVKQVHPDARPRDIGLVFSGLLGDPATALVIDSEQAQPIRWTDRP